ncbi:hypothetical protein QQX98_001358 [Neonectria punicea]|uniref:N-acetyltransferase ESCO zinc-finger domain-containing protein n=1 Tax=Neonectria punicea TaxID=979145 RepID=A0ABR1HP70_9HYPO
MYDLPMGQAGTDSRPRKALRTYGKRAAATDARGEFPLKKLRTSEEPETENPKAGSSPAPRTDANTDNGTAASQKMEVRKGSIMNFFKPVPQSVPQPLPAVSIPQIDKLESESTPSASPLASSRIEARRKPRILKFRGNWLPRIKTEAVDESETGSEPNNNEEDGQDEEEESRKRPRPQLQPRQSPRNEAQEVEKSRKPKAKPSPTVQTTLNISSQAAFSECKVCNTVWNPLHPEDVKFHRKQHAGVMRAKRKLKESEL